jgi:hypothetical protein
VIRVPFRSTATHSHESKDALAAKTAGETYASQVRETPPHDTPPSGKGSRVGAAGDVGGADVVGHDRPRLPPENPYPATTISDKW